MNASIRHTHARFTSIILLCLVLFAALSAGCTRGGGATDPSKVSGKAPRGSKPYTIRGKTYYPVLSAHGYTEEGVASWYGSDFHGKATANGERYDMHGMTAAHKLLPFNTHVKVTNKNNGRSIVVRVNDRGPFVADRVIDLTKTGADKLGMLGPGTAPVLLETVGTVPGLKGDDLQGKFYVQVGAFASKGNAERLAARFTASGRSARVKFMENTGLWRVQVGPHASLKHAESASDSLQGEFPGNFIAAD